MSHTYPRIWIHTVFGTKLRKPLIQPTFEQSLYEHIKNHFEVDFHCLVRIINGCPDHVHILFLLSPNYALKDILQNIKGESSHWVNEQDFMTTKFAWQIGYGAFSVSESNVEIVRRYIANQKVHHKQTSYVDEVRELLKEHGLSFGEETVETVSRM